MNIIMAIIGLVGLKRAPECIKMHHFEGENATISALDAPDNISGYGPGFAPPPAKIPASAHALNACFSFLHGPSDRPGAAKTLHY